MRVFVTCDEATAEAVLRDGWTDLHTDCGQDGVWCEANNDPFKPNVPSGITLRGPVGEVTLCQDIPEGLFDEFQFSEGTRSIPYGLTQAQIEERLESEEFVPAGYAIIPAERLNAAGKPELYSHSYRVGSRREQIDAIARREGADRYRSALAFLDRVGWRTAEEEEAEQD
jgi:hypothetical protein